MPRAALASSLALLSLAAGACGAPPEPVSPMPPVASAGPTAATAPAAPGPKPVAVTLATVGLDGAALDRKVDPCSDFYRFACGGWLDTTQIPADKPAYSRSFTVIADRNEADLRAIVE